MQHGFQTSFFSSRSVRGEEPVGLFAHLLVGGIGGGLFGTLWLWIVYPLVGIPTELFPGIVVFLETMLVGIIAGCLVFVRARRAYRKAFREGELLRWIFERTSVGIWIVDDQLKTVWWNEAMCSIVGRELKAGEDSTTCFTEEGRARIFHEISRRPSGVSSTYEATIRCPDGSTRIVQVAGSPIFSSESVFLGSFGVFQDITDQLQAQEEATEEARLNTVTATVARLNHRINNALMIIRGQSEVRMRLGADGEDAAAFKSIVEHVDIISRELEALSELKRVETKSYLGGRSMLRLPDEPTGDDTD